MKIDLLFLLLISSLIHGTMSFTSGSTFEIEENQFMSVLSFDDGTRHVVFWDSDSGKVKSTSQVVSGNIEINALYHKHLKMLFILDSFKLYVYGRINDSLNLLSEYLFDDYSHLMYLHENTLCLYNLFYAIYIELSFTTNILPQTKVLFPTEALGYSLIVQNLAYPVLNTNKVVVVDHYNGRFFQYDRSLNEYEFSFPQDQYEFTMFESYIESNFICSNLEDSHNYKIAHYSIDYSSDKLSMINKEISTYLIQQNVPPKMIAVSEDCQWLALISDDLLITQIKFSDLKEKRFAIDIPYSLFFKGERLFYVQSNIQNSFDGLALKSILLSNVSSQIESVQE